MLRVDCDERPDWKQQAEKLGFIFHTMYGEPYWDETRFYQFTLEEIERDLEDPTEELHAMCLAVVEQVVNDEARLRRLAIPEIYWDWIATSWRDRDPSLYGRFDLLYDGIGPAKMLEYNADTPTALYESAFFQWVWLEQNIEARRLPADSDQFNSIQDRLVERLAEIFEAGATVHFASCKDTDEDRQTVRYLEDCAKQAGLLPRFVYVEDIGLDADGRFADSESIVIDYLFKLYPWEMMFREAYGPNLPRAKTFMIEPPWKALLSNKGLLPLLWAAFPGHPNLLPAFFDGDARASELGADYVRKPLFSREGANIEVHRAGAETIVVDGEYGEEGHIVQAFHAVPRFGDDYTVIGSWMIGNQPCGIGIREDKSVVTRDLSRFVPHVIR